MLSRNNRKESGTELAKTKILIEFSLINNFFSQNCRLTAQKNNRFQGQTPFAMDWIETLFSDSSVNEKFLLKTFLLKTFAISNSEREEWRERNKKLSQQLKQQRKVFLVPLYSLDHWITPAQLIHKQNTVCFLKAANLSPHDLWSLRFKLWDNKAKI